MRKPYARAVLLVIFGLVAGCGLAYQAGSEYRASKMEKTLKPGMSSAEVHQSWGEPDIRNYVDQHTEIWSYAKRANSNDVTASVLYTSAKEGDQGTFLDLKFNDGNLVSWKEAQHTMPKKEGGGFNAGFGGSPQSGTAHY
jgi:hypothetical protein